MALDCDHIIDNIVLGSYPAILTSKFQQEIKPRIIISMTPEEETYINTAKFSNVECYRFPISSKMKSEDIITSIVSGANILLQETARDLPSNIYIHCYEGVNRSAATVVYYMHLKYKWNLEHCIEFLSSKRKISINETMMAILEYMIPTESQEMQYITGCE